MIKVGLLSFSLLLLTACGDSEPVATSYKKSMAAGAAPATGTTTGTGDATALKAQGTTLYNSKCAGCHSAITASAKSGATYERIKAGAADTNHSGTKVSGGYPTLDTDYRALAAALAK